VKLEDARRLVEMVRSHYAEYHNHKERMAHAAVLLQVGLFAAVMWADQWPGWLQNIKWTRHIQLSPEAAGFTGFAIIWLLVHIYVRWQLRNRREAAVQVAAMMIAQRKWATDPPSEEQLQCGTPENADHKSAKVHMRKSSRFKAFCDYLFPVPSATLHSDIGVKDYPKAVIELLREQREVGTGAVLSEWLLFVASALMFIMVWIRTFRV